MAVARGTKQATGSKELHDLPHATLFIFVDEIRTNGVRKYVSAVLPPSGGLQMSGERCAGERRAGRAIASLAEIRGKGCK